MTTTKKNKMYFRKKILILFIIFLSLIINKISFSSIEPERQKVNILSWWGYLTSPWVHKMIMDKCHIRISYDEYYSTDEFIRRFREHESNYDIIIFPEMAYKVFKSEITNYHSNLYKNVDNYEPNVKIHYKNEKFPSNVVYFLLNFEGFLYNPNIIKISKSDTMIKIFEKSKSKTVVLTDEPIFIYFLLGMHANKKPLVEYLNYILHLTEKSKLLITSEINSAFNDPNFAFIYTWPGMGLYVIGDLHKNYFFMLHPQLSYASADLLATLNANTETTCVGKVMSSKEFLTKMQNDALYFSPYGDSKSINNIFLKKSQSDFFKNLPKLKWFPIIEEHKYDELNQAWKYFKLNLDHNTKQ